MCRTGVCVCMSERGRGGQVRWGLVVIGQVRGRCGGRAGECAWQVHVRVQGRCVCVSLCVQGRCVCVYVHAGAGQGGLVCAGHDRVRTQAGVGRRGRRESLAARAGRAGAACSRPRRAARRSRLETGDCWAGSPARARAACPRPVERLLARRGAARHGGARAQASGRSSGRRPGRPTRRARGGARRTRRGPQPPAPFNGQLALAQQGPAAR